MSLRNCPIAYLCQNYSSGDNKPRNNDVRDKFACIKFIDMSCELSVRIQREAMGLQIACKLKRRVK